jgi:hypothetical protein
MENILPDKPTAPPATHYKAGIPPYSSLTPSGSFGDLKDPISVALQIRNRLLISIISKDCFQSVYAS